MLAAIDNKEEIKEDLFDHYNESDNDSECFIEDLRDDLEDRLQISQLPQLSLFAKMFTFLGRVITPQSRRYIAYIRNYKYRIEAIEQTVKTDVLDESIKESENKTEDCSIKVNNDENTYLAVPDRNTMNGNDEEIIVNDPTKKVGKERVEHNIIRPEEREANIPQIMSNTQSATIRSRKMILSNKLIKSLQAMKTEFKLPISNNDDMTLFQDKFFDTLDLIDLSAASTNTIGFSNKELKLVSLIFLHLITSDVIDSYSEKENITWSKDNLVFESLFEFPIFYKMALTLKNETKQSISKLDATYYESYFSLLDKVCLGLGISSGQFKLLVSLFKR